MASPLFIITTLNPENVDAKHMSSKHLTQNISFSNNNFHIDDEKGFQ